MTSIKEAAKAYVPNTTKNICELDKVSVNMDIESRVCKQGEPDEYTMDVALIDGEEYRVPASVLKQLKTQLEASPNLTLFKVVKEGEGREGTRYTVVPMPGTDK